MNDNVQDTNNAQPNMMDPNRPRLKKVKRPIRRPEGGFPTPPRAEGVANTPLGGMPTPPRADNAAASPVPPRAQNFAAPIPPVAESFDDGIVNDLENLDNDVIESANEDVLTAPTNIPEVDAFNLDSYLDEDANLPAVQEKDEEEKFNPSNPKFIDDSDLDEHGGRMPLIVNGMFSRKAVGIVAGVVFVIGFLIGKVLFSEEKVVRDGLQGVVINSEVPRGRARCGMAEKTQGCVLYIMNPQRQELNARDFYDLASQLTGRQRFLIETGNMRYSSVKIKPGSIAQLNIPPLQ